MNNSPNMHVDMINILFFQNKLIEMLKSSLEESSTMTSTDFKVLYQMYRKFNESYPSIASSSQFKGKTAIEYMIAEQQKILQDMAPQLLKKHRQSLTNLKQEAATETIFKPNISSITLHSQDIDSCANTEPSSSEGSKVLGLLQKQKDMVSQDIQEERISHSLLTSELAETTYILKEATMQIREKVLEQNVQLDSLETYAGSNMASLEEQRKMVTWLIL
jgi:hypothetical protein